MAFCKSNSNWFDTIAMIPTVLSSVAPPKCHLHSVATYIQGHLYVEPTKRLFHWCDLYSGATYNLGNMVIN